MNDLIQSLRGRWAGWSPRERVLVAVMAVAVLAVGGWYGLVAPLRGWSEAAETRADRAAARLAELEAARQAGSLPGVAAAGARKPLGALLDETAGPAGLVIDRRREEAGGAITVWLQGVEAPVMMGWLTTLARGQGVSVAELTASRTEGGLLDAQITLARAAP